MRDECDYSLLRHNTFGMNYRCSRFLEYSSVDEAKEVAKELKTHPQSLPVSEGRVDTPFLIIGGGSNLLLTGNYEGTVVHSAIRGISLTEYQDEAILRCGSGETWDDVVAWTAGLGFFDLVNLSLIPGEVGASAVQNIGAYGAEAAQTIYEVRAIEIASGNAVCIKAEDCRYGYRDSRFKHDWKDKYLITHVVYRLNRNTQPKLDYGNIRSEVEKLGECTPSKLRQAIIDIRRAKLPDPAELGNAGSFFMNPVVSKEKYEALIQQYPQMPHYAVSDSQEKIPAGWLIEQCGWKGKSLGRAGVYEKQALVLVNLGSATGDEVKRLCSVIQQSVRERFGIELKPEVNVV